MVSQRLHDHSRSCKGVLLPINIEHSRWTEKGGKAKIEPGEPRERRLERQKQWGALASQYKSANLVSGCATPFPLQTDMIQRWEESHEQTFVSLFLLKETEEAKEKELRDGEKKRSRTTGNKKHRDEKIVERKKKTEGELKKKKTKRQTNGRKRRQRTNQNSKLFSLFLLGEQGRRKINRGIDRE